MDYAAWKLFIDAAELGSLSKVALAYGTSQPHISRQISELEQECGGRLFQRTGRGVVLTELGQRIAPKVRAWMAGTEQLENDVRTSAGTPIGKVRIGSLPSTAHPLVSTLYKRLKERYPLDSARGARRARSATRDMAGRWQCRSCHPLSNERVAEEWRYLPRRDINLSRQRCRRSADISADGTFSALHDLPLVLFCRPNSWRNHLEQIGAEHGVSLNVAFEADSLSLQTHIVSEGGIYALLGPYAIAAAKGTPSAIIEIGGSSRNSPHCPRNVASWKADARMPDCDAGRARDSGIWRGGTATRTALRGLSAPDQSETCPNGHEPSDYGPER